MRTEDLPSPLEIFDLEEYMSGLPFDAPEPDPAPPTPSVELPPFWVGTHARMPLAELFARAQEQIARGRDVWFRVSTLDTGDGQRQAFSLVPVVVPRARARRTTLEQAEAEWRADGVARVARELEGARAHSAAWLAARAEGEKDGAAETARRSARFELTAAWAEALRQTDAEDDEGREEIARQDASEQEAA